jgi:hypothetical protein
MKQTILILSILTFLAGQTYGQADTGTVYTNLNWQFGATQVHFRFI